MEYGDHKRALASSGAHSSRQRRPASARLPCASSQEVGFSRLVGSVSGPRIPRPEKHDLAAKIELAGIPKRYLRSLGAMGFGDVQQLLQLGRLGEQLDVILDDPLLNLSPGHRVAVNGWLRKEAAAAEATVKNELDALRREASVGRTATDIIEGWRNKQLQEQARGERLERELAQLKGVEAELRGRAAELEEELQMEDCSDAMQTETMVSALL